jgi:predicted membrane channel-forming protein YqfA (hemolysin III family)
MLLLSYSVLLFVFLGFVGVLMGISISFFKTGVWDFSRVDIVRLVVGALCYAVPAAIGIWVLSRIKDYKERKNAERNNDER